MRRYHAVWSWPTYHQMLLYTRNKNGLGEGISIVFEIFSNFLGVGLTLGVISNVLCILHVAHGIYTGMYLKILCQYLWRLYEEMLKLNSFRYSLGDLELSKMTLKYLGPQALISRNICYQQHQFLMRGLGNELRQTNWILSNILWVTLNLPKLPWDTLVHKPLSEGTFVIKNIIFQWEV
jgi:hypothetical protein